jgi:uncharacterized protein affecting Mg2+/Co2+ transport
MKQSLLDSYKDTKVEQAEVISINLGTGRVGLFLRNGLESTGIYLYDVKELYIGVSVLCTKVNDSYVILTKIPSNKPRSVFSTRIRPVAICTKSISYSVNGEPADEYDPLDCYYRDEIVLSVVDPSPLTVYTWTITDVDDSVVEVTGDSITYTAPETSGTAVIQLSSNLITCDVLSINVGPAPCGNTHIGYTSLEMFINEQQTLHVDNPTDGVIYHWDITQGGGTLSSGTGLSVVYTAPAANPNCSLNPIITLSTEFGALCDGVQVAINQNIGGNAYASINLSDYPVPSCANSGTGYWYCSERFYNFTCTGTPTTYYEFCDTAPSIPWCSQAVYEWGQQQHPHSPWPIDCTGKNTDSSCPTSFNGPVDVRTEAMKLAGCCPEALL